MFFFSKQNRILPSKINETESTIPNQIFSGFFLFINVNRKEHRRMIAIIISENWLRSTYKAEIIPAHKGTIMRRNGIFL
jgi:hypothetical protein